MNRIENLQKLLSEHELDAILLKNPKNRRYITGFPSTDGTVLITKREVFCFVDSRYIEAARQTVKSATIGLVSREMPLKAWIERALTDCCVTHLGFEDDYLPYNEYTRFRDMLNTKLTPASSLMTELRASKDSLELVSMKKAQAITDAVFSELLGFIRPGVSEREIATQISCRQLKLGAEGNSFDPIVVTGKKIQHAAWHAGGRQNFKRRLRYYGFWLFKGWILLRYDPHRRSRLRNTGNGTGLWACTSRAKGGNFRGACRNTRKIYRQSRQRHH